MTRSVHGGWKVSALAAVVLLTATACSKSSTPATASYDVFAQQYRYHGMPTSIPSGDFQVNFSNKESFPIVHEMILAALPSGDTAQTVIDSAKVAGCTGGGPCEAQYLHFGEVDDVSTGATISQVFNLPAGTYFFACWQQGTQSNPDSTTDPPHASKGMVFTFTVT
jgi:hypothetical protein